MQVELTDSEKRLLFWASFLSLAAAGFGFAYRVNVLGVWGAEFGLDGQQLGQIFGASLWPIAVTMILFSLIVDQIGYKVSIYCAFVLQALSVLLTCMAGDYNGLYIAALCAGLGHGIVEAVINPVCAAVYPKEKTLYLNILHAAWPAGLVGGALFILIPKDMGIIPIENWQVHACWMLIPVVIYGLMYFPCKFPVDERVAAQVPYKDMLKEVGFLGAFLPAMLLFYELFRIFTGSEPTWLLYAALGFGLLVGGAFGAYTKALGKPLFAFLCLLMIPLATTELGTDAWIKELMTPVLKEDFNIDAGYMIAVSAFIMMILRFQAGFFTKRFSPPTILVISSFFSMCGLMALSSVGGILIFGAFVLYAVGQTFYWPTVLGFVSERYPRGGALTLNTVSAIGLLSVGIIGTPIMGAFYDNNLSVSVKETVSETAYEAGQAEKNFFGVTYQGMNKADAEAAATAEGKAAEFGKAVDKAGRGALFTTALAFPLVMLICYGIISMYFRSIGGYKPVLLDEEQEALQHDPGV